MSLDHRDMEPGSSWADRFNPNEPEKAMPSERQAKITEMVLRRELHLAKARILELELEKMGVHQS